MSKESKKKGDVEIDQVIILLIALIVLVALIIIAFTSKDRLLYFGDKFYNILRFLGAR